MIADSRADMAMNDWENEGGTASSEPVSDLERDRDFAYAFRRRTPRNTLGAARAGCPSCPFPRGHHIAV